LIAEQRAGRRLSTGATIAREEEYAGKEMVRIAEASGLTVDTQGGGWWLGDNLYGQTTDYHTRR
jgi:hypothetical protein